MKSIGVVIPTYNAARHLERCIKPILEEGFANRMLIVDSSSTDDTVGIARRMSVDVDVIPKQDFNHGGTRDFGRKIVGTDIVVFLTQDAYPEVPNLVERLTRPLLDGTASVAYGRQIPRPQAGLLESIPREFNYPLEGQVRDISSLHDYGTYTFFCSNSCSAYVNQHLDDVGGFGRILTHEDYFAVARMLLAGRKIAYIADAVVEHSHQFTLLETFRRYFEAGYARSENPWIRTYVRGEESRGVALGRLLLKKLVRQEPLSLPRFFLQYLLSWAGFRIGTIGHSLPVGLCRRLSTQPNYWNTVQSPR